MRWINDITAQNFLWTDGQGKEWWQRLQVRPILPLEIVFPRENLKEVLSIVQPYSSTPWTRRLAPVLQKTLGLKPIQHVIKPSTRVEYRNIWIAGIGLRDDKNHPDGTEMI